MTAVFGYAAYNLVFTTQLDVCFSAVYAIPAQSAVLYSVSFFLVQY